MAEEKRKKIKLGAIMHQTVVKEDTPPQEDTPQKENIGKDTPVPKISIPKPEVPPVKDTNTQSEVGNIQEIKSSIPESTINDGAHAIGIHKDETEENLPSDPVSIKEREEKKEMLEKLRKVQNIGINDEKKKAESEQVKEENKEEDKEVFKKYEADLYAREDKALQEEKMKKNPSMKKEEVIEEKKEMKENTDQKMETTTQIPTPKTQEKGEIKEVQSNSKQNTKEEKNSDVKEKKKKKPMTPIKKFLISTMTLASILVIIGGVFFIDTGSDFIENYKTSILDMVNKNVSEEEKEEVVEEVLVEKDEEDTGSNSGTTQNWAIENIIFGRNDNEVKVYENNGVKEFEYDGEIFNSKEAVYNKIRIVTIKNVILDYFKLLK